MTVLVDPPSWAGHGRLWSHLASDSSFAELHRFASRLGIPRRGFDRDHYDVPADRYDQVVAAGATPVSSRELVRRLHESGLRRRKAGTLGPRPAGRVRIRPPRLVQGDTVAVVAPSGPAPEPRLDAGLDVLRAWGLVVHEMPHVRGRDGQLGYLAAADTARVADLTAAWTDPEVTAVFCARGGYGAQRIVDLLDWAVLAAAPVKPLVGFSDVTALHQAFGARLGMATLLGPVVTSLGAGDDESREHLRRTLFEPEQAQDLTPRPGTPVVGGSAEGVLVGGNLALLAADIGTPTAAAATDAIVVLEDVDESPYRLDRLLTQLLRSGWFDGVRGVAVGQLTGCGSADAARRVVADRLTGLGVPLVADLPVGHADHNLTVALGVRARLDGDAGTLRLLTPALA